MKPLLDDYINRVKHLPPAPRVLPQLLALLGRPDIDSSRVVGLIASDSALAAGVLQLCNSAYFSGATPAEDLQEAVTRLGFKKVCQLVAAVSGSRALGASQKGYGMEAGELWRHSVAVAFAARLIARDAGEEESGVFTAALLHDVGKIVLAEAWEEKLAGLVEEEKEPQAMVTMEERILGVQHAETGGRLLARWQFPASLVAGVCFHHDPAGARPFHRLAACVYLGNVVAHFLGRGYGRHAFAFDARPFCLETLGLGEKGLDRHLIETSENLKAVDALAQVAA